MVPRNKESESEFSSTRRFGDGYLVMISFGISALAEQAFEQTVTRVLRWHSRHCDANIENDVARYNSQFYPFHYDGI